MLHCTRYGLCCQSVTSKSRKEERSPMSNNQPKLNTIDGATLMAKPFMPLPFIVDTLLSQGLHILAGSSKVGKS